MEEVAKHTVLSITAYHESQMVEYQLAGETKYIFHAALHVMDQQHDIRDLILVLADEYRERNG